MQTIRPNSNWPDYLPGPREDILAIGVIALMYGQLENMFRILFATVGQLNEHQVDAVFDRMGNRARLDALSDLLEKTTLPEELKQRVLHFRQGFTICAENRHAIMHSHSGGIYTNYKANSRGILLTKTTRGGKKFVHPAVLSGLREVADATHRFVMFGSRTITDIKVFLLCRDRDDEAAFWRAPLKDKPALPSNLNWSLLESLTHSPRPGSSPE